MPRPLLFCNVGWMRNYQGLTANDQIIGGGRYVQIEKRGHEVCNYVDAHGSMYGYVQPVGSRIALERLGASTDADRLTGVDVIVTARRPHGDTVVVGWYRNATIYRDAQPLTKPTALHKKNGVNSFRFTARASDVKLLHPEDRSEIVPRGKGGMGQSNVWYAEEASAAWLTRIRQLIQRGKSIAPHKGKRPPPNVFKNAQVEAAAMALAWTHYEERGYWLQDVSKANLGWDLEATAGKLTLRIEVKGLSGKVASIELTPNEYKAFQKTSLDYRLCIVTNALTTPALAVCTFNPVNGAWTIEAGKNLRRIAIRERIAANILLT